MAYKKETCFNPYQDHVCVTDLACASLLLRPAQSTEVANRKIIWIRQADGTKRKSPLFLIFKEVDMKNGEYPTDGTLKRYRHASSDIADEGEKYISPKPAMPRDTHSDDDEETDNASNV